MARLSEPACDAGRHAVVDEEPQALPGPASRGAQGGLDVGPLESGYSSRMRFVVQPASLRRLTAATGTRVPAKTGSSRHGHACARSDPGAAAACGLAAPPPRAPPGTARGAERSRGSTRPESGSSQAPSGSGDDHPSASVLDDGHLSPSPGARRSLFPSAGTILPSSCRETCSRSHRRPGPRGGL